MLARILAFLCIFLLGSSQAFADSKESALTTVAPTGTDLSTGLQSGVNVNYTNNSIANLMKNASNLNTGSIAAALLPAFTGDCTTSAGTVATICTKFNGGTSFGSAAGANTGTSGATLGFLNGTLTFSGADTFSSSLTVNGTLTTNMTGGPFCVHETSGVLSATASDCGAGGGGTGTVTQLTAANASVVLNPTTITTAGTIAVPTATTSLLGLVKPDGTSIILSNGFITSTGAGAALTVTDGTNTIANTTTITLSSGFIVSGSGGSAVVNLTTPTRALTSSGSILSTDGANIVTMTSGSSTTLTFPQAGTTNFGAGFSVCGANLGAGVETLSTTTSTFNGLGTTVALSQGGSFCLASDGTNWNGQIVENPAPGGGSGTVTSLTGTAGQIVLTPSTITTAGTISLPSTITQATTFSAAVTFSTINGYLANVITDATTARTLSSTDCGTFVKFTNAGAVTVTLPNNLSTGCQVAMEQNGAGQVTLSAAGGAALHSAHSYTKTFGQNAVIGVTVDGNSGGTSAVYAMSGDGA